MKIVDKEKTEPITKLLEIRHNKMEKVKTENGMIDVKMTAEEAQDVCKMGAGDGTCCAYLGCGPTGFCCLKGTDSSVIIKKRLEKGTMNAKGEGEWEGCAWEKEKPPVFNETKSFTLADWINDTSNDVDSSNDEPAF